jgi:Glycosyltransferase family 87
VWAGGHGRDRPGRIAPDNEQGQVVDIAEPLVFLAVMVAVVALGLLTGMVGGARGSAPPLAVTLGVALVLRLLVVAIAFHRTPFDVAVWFRNTGLAVLHHQDPLLALPRYEWNFLPAMPYLHALELSTGLPWELAGKICPVLADLVTTVLVGSLAAPERAARVRWQYAVHPLPLLVVAWHGQIEPIAVALGLAALWAARREKTGVAGLLLGLAAAVKTWPVLFAPGVLRETPRRRWPLVAATAVLPPLLLLASMPLLLGSDLSRSLHVLGSYRGNTGIWGWTGIQWLAGNVGQGFAGPRVDPYQRLGLIAVLVALGLVVLVFWSRLDGTELTAALILAFLAVTAGFGSQYLLWPAALLMITGRWRAWVYLTLAAGYAVFFYLVFFPAPTIARTHLLVYGSVPVIAAALLALPWERGPGMRTGAVEGRPG